MSFKIVRNDITKMNTDAIVNTANPEPIYGSGCDYAVYKAAGEDELLKYRRENIGEVEEGEVFITPAFNLPVKYIIHAVSPIYVNGHSGEEDKLRGCYRKSLSLAFEKGLSSIAFPLISTGGFGYPKEEGMLIAIEEINNFLIKHQMDVYLVVFDSKSTQLGLNISSEVEQYIDHNYVCEKREEEYGDAHFGSVDPCEPSYDAYMNMARDIEHHEAVRRQKRESVDNSPRPFTVGGGFDSRQREARPLSVRPSAGMPKPTGKASKPSFHESMGNMFGFKSEKSSAEEIQTTDFMCATPCADWDEDPSEKFGADIRDRVAHMSDTFSDYLFYLIDQKGYKNDDVWKRSLVDKKVFSKIKTHPDYHPKKLTALCLCVGMRLNLDETKDLLARAGYALSPCDKTDLIFSYFIENEIFDMIEVDLQLEEHGLNPIIA